MIKQNLYSVTFSESLTDYEIISQKLVGPEKPHITLWRRIACLIIKATRAHAPTPTHPHTHTKCNTYCFSTAAVVSWKRLNDLFQNKILFWTYWRQGETQVEDSWFFGVKLHDLVVAPDVWSSHSAFRNGGPKVPKECTLLVHVVTSQTKTSSSTPPWNWQDSEPTLHVCLVHSVKHKHTSVNPAVLRCRTGQGFVQQISLNPSHRDV
jgi:hypothetical protein